MFDSSRQAGKCCAVWEHDSIDNAANWIEVVVAFVHGPSISGPGATNVGRQVQRLRNRAETRFQGFGLVAELMGCRTPMCGRQ